MENQSNHHFNIKAILILTSLSVGVMSFFLPIYSKALEMNALEIAGLFSLVSFILIIMRPLMGLMIDKIGRKPILSIAIIFCAISYLIYSISSTAVLLYTARTIQAIGDAMMTICIYTIVADTHRLQYISKGFGKVDSAKSIGNICGCLIAFFLLTKLSFFQGWKVLFIIFALSSLFALLKVIATFQEDKNTIKQQKFKFSHYSSATYKLLFITFICSFSSAMISPILMIYLQDHVTTDIASLALTFFPSIILTSFLAVKIGHICDQLGKNKSMMIGMLIVGLSIIIIPHLKSLLIFMLIWTISSIGSLMYNLAKKGLYTELNTMNNNGEIFGIYTFVSELGITIGPLLGGLLYESISTLSPFYLNGITLIIMAMLIPILFQKINT